MRAHQVMCEEGYVVPNTMVVASDSHSNMYGGLGALGTPVVRTDAASIWATGETWWQVPPVAKGACPLPCFSFLFFTCAAKHYVPIVNVCICVV